MGAGILTAVWMCLLLGQNPSDPLYTNQRNHRIPVNIQESRRKDIKELLLYASTDQGRSWEHVAGPITPDKSFFAFYAKGDGAYWLRVAYVNQLGQQEPDGKALMNGPPDLTMVIDTIKPVIHTFQAQRVGDEIVMSWELQEDHPDLSRDGFRLEYQVKDSLSGAWTPISVQPALQGKTSFRPTSNQTLVVRLTVRDLAGNQSYSPAEIAGTVAVAAAGFTAPVGNGQGNNANPVLPVEIAIPKQPTEAVQQPILPPPPTGDHTALFGNTGGAIKPPPALEKSPLDKVVADSRTPPQADVVKPAPRDPQLPTPPVGGMLDVKAPVAAPPVRKLPMLQYINQHLIKLQYEMRRVGPSGIGGIEIWLTKDDGATWEAYAKVKDKEVENEVVQGSRVRDFEFRDEKNVLFTDGVYGLNLVVKNRAGLGRTPRPGDAPEIRVEIDTEKPFVQLLEPVPDPRNPSQLLLKWNAIDKNLAAAPINLEYAEKLDGPWLPIKLDLENTGRYPNEKATGDYSWTVPPNTPVQVYLRVRVRDKAGNEGVAATPRPQYVDLIEPEGALIGILPTTKR
jgi:hypothetical protein